MKYYSKIYAALERNVTSTAVKEFIVVDARLHRVNKYTPLKYRWINGDWWLWLEDCVLFFLVIAYLCLMSYCRFPRSL